MQPTEVKPAVVKPAEVKPVEAKPVNAKPVQIENDVYAGLEEAYVHPVINNNDSAEELNPDLGLPLVESIIDKTADLTKNMYKEPAPASPANAQAAANAPAQANAQVQVNGQAVNAQAQTNAQAPVNAQGQPNAQAQVNNQNVQGNAAQNNVQQNNQYQGKDKKHNKKKDQFPDARMKPGKGYKPFKPNENFKEAPKFQAADPRKSNLKIEDIPCIAVIEENIVPTIDEVPFIGIPEDNSIPTMEKVPFVGVEDGEAGKPIPDVPFLGIEDGETGKPIPDVPYLGAEDGEKGKPIPNVPYLGIKEGEDAIAEELAKEAEQTIAEIKQEENAVVDNTATSNVSAPAENAANSNIETPVVNDVNNNVVNNVPQPEPQKVVIPKGMTLAQMAERNKQIAAPATPTAPLQVETVTQPEIPVQSAAAAQAVAAAQPAPVTQSVAAVQPAVAPQNVAPVQTASSPQNTAPAQPKKQPQRMPVIAKDVRQVVASAIKKYKQLVFIGPSGTGKTYQVRKFARKNTKGYDGFKFVQFHPSYEYSDFIEGLRPVNIINTSTATNVRLDGVFKAFCRKIVEDNLEHAVPGFSSLYSEKKQKVIQELYENIRDRKEAMEDGGEVQDFDRDSKEYVFDHGVREYYFIIDELNRAEASKVFGDVMFALDEDYRGIENRFDTRLSNLKSYRIIQADDIGKTNYTTSHIGFAEQMKFDCFERGFFIPRNLHIIGTMNELGGMMEDFDFSLKQKFRWIKINPAEIMKASLNEMLKDKDIYWLDQFANNLNLVNRLISEGFSDEYCLGPAFFRKLGETPDSIDEVFDLDVEPVLKEYLKGKPDDITDRFISECRKALKLGI